MIIIIFYVNSAIDSFPQRYNRVIWFIFWRNIITRININGKKYIPSHKISPEEMTQPSIFKSDWRVYRDEENLTI